MKKFLQQILNKVVGLHYILITDKDGVPFIKGKSLFKPMVNCYLVDVLHVHDIYSQLE